MKRKLLFAAALLVGALGFNANAQKPAIVSEIEDGKDFYIVNVETGKYLGGGNSWGTHASIIEHGIPFTVAKISDGVYTLDSHTYNSVTNHYLAPDPNNGEMFIDGVETNIYIKSLGEGKYSISISENGGFLTASDSETSTVVENNASDANSTYAQWYFVSKTDRERIICEAENGGDATFYLAEADFSRNLRKAYGVTAWKGNFVYPTGNQENDNTRPNFCVERYHAVTNVYQTVLVPNGKYEVTCQGFYRKDDNTNVPSYLYANDVVTELAIFNDNGENTTATMTGATASFNAGLYVNKLEVTVTDNKLTVGVKTDGVNNWICWDNFTLKLIDNTNVAKATDELQNTVLKYKNIGFDKGDYAPYNQDIEALATLNLIDVNMPYSYNTIDIDGYTWTPNTEEVNAVYDGTFATAVHDGAPLGWTMTGSTLGGATHARAFNPDSRLSEFNETSSGFFIRFDDTNSGRGALYYYGRTDGYTMPLKANTYYTVSIDFTNWGTTDEKPLRLNVVGPDFAVDKTVNSKKDADKGDNKPDNITITFKTAEAGNYEIFLQCPGSDDNKHMNVVSNIILKRTVVTIDEDKDYTPSDITTANVELNRTIKEGINTLVLPFDVEDVSVFGEGSKVYEFSAYNAETQTITFKEADEIKANIPCLLKATKATGGKGTYTFENVTFVAGEPTKEADDVSFIGTYAPTILAATTTGNYVVSDDKLYLVDSDVSVKATRAYFTVEGASEAGVKSISMSFGDDATGIVNVVESEAKSGKIYDLQGREVKNPARGIYIIDGKKVFLNK